MRDLKIFNLSALRKKKGYKLATIALTVGLIGSVVVPPIIYQTSDKTDFIDSEREPVKIECVNGGQMSSVLENIFFVSNAFVGQPLQYSYKIKDDTTKIKVFLSEEEMAEILDTDEGKVTFMKDGMSFEIDAKELKQRLKQAKQDRIDSNKGKSGEAIMIILIIILAGSIFLESVSTERKNTKQKFMKK